VTTIAAAPADDLALVRRYATSGSAEAFAAVVARHADFVFATALRQTRDRELAEDVTQATFIVLARRAGNFRDGTSVAAFLHHTAVYASKNALRATQRRRWHESRAAVDPAAPAAPNDPTGEDETVVAVDSALTRLREPDRHLLMLHYFDGLTIAESAARLRITHEAARKRLHRALERLRGHLTGAGVTMSAAAIPAVVAAMGKQSVEAQAASIASMALAGGTQGGAFSLAHEVLRTFQLLAMKKAAAAIAIVAVVTTSATVAVTHAARPTLATAPEAEVVQSSTTPNVTIIRVPQRQPQAGRYVQAGPASAPKVLQAQPPPASRPAVPTIIDYPKVFESMQLTMVEKARLELERVQAMQNESQRVKQLGDMRRKIAATTEPVERAKLEAELALANGEHDEIVRGQQAVLAEAQTKAMIECFREIEAAVAKVAAAQGVHLPPPPPYPANMDQMNSDQLRQHLITRRFLPRPPGAPDLTDAVLTLLNQRPAAPTSTPSTVPASR
jgi:RNA polymerase sigma factor (sigma-70 family)